MDIDIKVFGQLIEAIMDGGAKKAIKYISPNFTVKATRKLFNGKIDKRSKITEIFITFGKPNFEEREFIKKAKKAGMQFPFKDIVIKPIK